MEKHTILIIDDDLNLRSMLREALELSNFTVIEASTGEDGLMHAFSEKPSLILLDISMPQMNGYQVLSKLRKDKWGKDVKVILLTAIDSFASMAQGIDLESNAYLVKSQITLESIVKSVNYHLFGYNKPE